MSNDDNNSLKSNIFDDDIKLSPIHNEEDENSNSSFSLSQKYPQLFINNENFINYFIHNDYCTSINNDLKEDLKEINNKNISNEESKSQNKIQTFEESHKKLILKESQKESGIIFDSKTGISYNEVEDPINYRKAKKRMQNRDSALRMKKMREVINSKFDDELFHIREDNIRLINENISLKKEKEFLIEQIKFMQKIIKESNLEFKLKNESSFDRPENNNINNNISNINSNSNDERSGKNVFYYDGSKQKIKGNLFNVFIIGTLSILYIIGECGLNTENSDNNGSQNTNLRSGNSIKLNSIKVNMSKGHSLWFFFSKIILLSIFILFIPLIKQALKIPKDFIRRYRIRNYFNNNKFH